MHSRLLDELFDGGAEPGKDISSFATKGRRMFSPAGVVRIRPRVLEVP